MFATLINMLGSRMERLEVDEEKKQSWRTLLYDCTIDLNLTVPHDDSIKKDWIIRTTLMTIVTKFVSQHEEYQHVTNSIYGLLQETLSLTRHDWKFPLDSEDELVVEKYASAAGHIVQDFTRLDLPVVYETISLSGDVSDDYDRPGPIDIDVTVELLLSPGVYAAKDIYMYRNFPVEPDEIANNAAETILYDWSNGAAPYQFKEDFDFVEAWDGVYSGVQEYEEYLEMKRAERNYYMEEHSDDDWF